MLVQSGEFHAPSVTALFIDVCMYRRHSLVQGPIASSQGTSQACNAYFKNYGIKKNLETGRFGFLTDRLDRNDVYREK